MTACVKQWGLSPDSFPLFQGVRAGPFNKVISWSGMFVLLGSRELGACAAARAAALNSCRLSEGCGHTRTSGAVRSVAPDRCCRKRLGFNHRFGGCGFDCRRQPLGAAFRWTPPLPPSVALSADGNTAVVGGSGDQNAAGESTGAVVGLLRPLLHPQAAAAGENPRRSSKAPRQTARQTSLAKTSQPRRCRSV
jgi:hypothetical protein